MSETDIRQLIGGQTAFAAEMARALMLRHSPASNLVFSPSSLHTVLGLVAAGSKGPTLHQTLSVLRSPAPALLASQLLSLIFVDGAPTGGPLLFSANAVFVDNSLPLKPTFHNVVTASYRARLAKVDFQTKAAEVANEVNSWAEKETNGLIKGLLPSGSVDNTTRLILANSLYFKGAWNVKFDASKTEDADFYLTDGSSVQVPFMTSKKKQVLRAFDGFKVLKLPYKQGEDKRQFSMYFYLPDDKNGLQNLVEKLGSESGFIDRHLPLREVPVGQFRIPRFKISYGFEASPVLKDLGLILPFTGEADLTEMAESVLGQKLFVSSIFHKSFIEVNEEGTEAGAASAAVVTLRSLCRDDPIDFVADHPFLFLIREDQTQVGLFIGQVVNPLVAS